MYNDLHDCMILFSSSTSLQRAKQKLSAAGIRTEEIRPPSGLSGGSCAYALTVSAENLARARRRIGDVPHGGAFCKTRDGYREA